MDEHSQTAGFQMQSSPPPGPGLRRARAADVHRLKIALAEAFHDDPIFGWLMPHEPSRPARLRRFFAIELEHVVLARGQAWTSCDLAGVATSTPPGAWRVPPRAMLLQGVIFGVNLPRVARLLPRLEWRHLREPHYYFPYIGVAPQAQGRGLGSRLMRPTLDRCDREGLPAYLEASSERNAALYERLGFQVKSELRVGASPPLRLMVRRPTPDLGR
jgi:ribosomal protein S18 acetylase RimI-like enzyme